MKKLLILLFSATIALIQANGQNFFPLPAGNAGIGLGNGTTPVHPLTFGNDHGDKISLWGNSTNSSSIGFGVQAGLLQIHSNQASDDIAFGFGSSRNFTEQMRIKGNGRIGIGTSNPNAPLSFPAQLGKKITLYPGNTGDVGFAVAGNRLQIYSDNPNADVAIGFDAANTFNERFAVKPNGALAVKFSTGNPGQVLTSGGSASSAEWKSPSNFIFQNSISKIETTTFTVGGNGMKNISGLSHLIGLNGRSKILVNYQVLWNGDACLVCPAPSGFVDVLFDGLPISRTAFSALGATPASTTGSILFNPAVTTGNHTIDLRVTSTSAHDILITGATQGSINFGATNMSILIITE